MAFFARWNAGGDHPINKSLLAVRQPGGDESYTPTWYRKRKWYRQWCEGDSERPPASGIVYLGSPGDHECPPGKYFSTWPFTHMRSRGVGQALYEVGVAHLNYWSTAGMDHPSRLYAGRAEQRRAVYRFAVAALMKREHLTRKPVAAVVEKVVIGKASLDSIRYLSRYRNNSYATRELMNVLCDGLRVLEEYYGCVGEWEETSWRAGDWADTYVNDDGEEVSIFEASWPQHWTRFLREHRYWEERENREERDYTKAKIRQLI